MRTTWNDRALDPLRSALVAGMGRGGETLVAAIRAAIAEQGPPPSAPGEAPHRVTGALQGSYDNATDEDNLQEFVGSTSVVAAYMELGTSTIAPRPHIIPTLLEQADEIAHQICRT